MGSFSLNQEVAIDLGTANTIIIYNNKIVVDEPSIIAINPRTEKVIAVGYEAREMEDRHDDNIKTVRPLKDGVIADFVAAELMMREMIKKITSKRKLFSPSLKVVICVPSGCTDVELRAVKDSAEHAGGRDIYMIYEPMAAAMGIGIDVLQPVGNMVVDIGGGTTEIAVISLGGIVRNESIREAGDELTEDIVNYMKNQHNVRIGSRTAEEIKINVGSALKELSNPPEPFVVTGQGIIDPKPKKVAVTYQEISECLDSTLLKMEVAIGKTLQSSPAELYADVVKNGIYLTGGGALIRGLDKRFSSCFEIPFIVAEDPLHSVANGTGLALKNISKLNFLIR